jgi:primosomal protein N' (replication factor Y)
MSSETKIELVPGEEPDHFEMEDDEYLVYEALRIQNSLNLKEIMEILNKKSVYPVINSLLNKNLINIREEIVKNYKPKKIKYIKLHHSHEKDPDLLEAFELTKRSKHQTNALIAFAQLKKTKKEITKKSVIDLANITSSDIKKIVTKGIFEEYEKTISRLKPFAEEHGDLPDLSSGQQKIIEEIDSIFKTKSHVLLHGVTGSGKTRIYQEYIKRTIDSGGQVLFLVPEIGLTTHLINRLAAVFGQDVYVFHSKLNQNERVEIWNAVKNGKPVILAARSGIFLPFDNLKLIIVDEEHDNSYKQQNPAPRYNARDLAAYIGSVDDVKVIFGSATPSIESYHNAKTGKYGYVRLDQRFGNVSMPEIRLVDMRIKSILLPNNSKYSIPLTSMIQQTLNKDEQVLLFQNRRGDSPTVVCNKCGWDSQCPNCDVSMTYHKYTNELKCHYCGHRENVPNTCPRCGSANLVFLGYGTEKIETELKNIFPDAKIKRMDMDTIRTKNDVENIMAEFEAKQIDILVGTQMITKGLDFDHIGLVGVIDIDRLMQFPDFRANERAFQLVLQVGGRAGRRKKQGLVIIQTHNPEHPMINDILNTDYFSFIGRELSEREIFDYPPFTRLIEITIMHKKPDKCSMAAFKLANELKGYLRNRVVGPAIPGISRIRGFYQFRIMIKLEKSGLNLKKIKDFIIESKNKVLRIEGLRSVRIKIDVDPY